MEHFKSLIVMHLEIKLKVIILLNGKFWIICQPYL